MNNTLTLGSNIANQAHESLIFALTLSILPSDGSFDGYFD